MKKILAVFLAALMICSAFSVLSFAAENEYPVPAAPENLALTADGVASWDAVDVPTFTEANPNKYDTSCAVKYKVTLSRWDFDAKEENWTYSPVTDEIETAETTVNLSEYLVSGKYIIAVTAVAEYTRMLMNEQTGEPTGKEAKFKKLSETTEMDRADAVQITEDMYAEPVDTSIPFESLVKEDDEQANGLLTILRKIKEVFAIILRFLGFAGDKTGITEEIMNKK